MGTGAVTPLDTRPPTRPPTRATSRSPLRADVQGLRAIAVLLVLAYHVTGHPRGGFVGVDVFFVVSGYLISGILVRQLASGGIDLPGFYARRIRRIVPVAVVVTLATVAAAYVVWYRPKADQVALDALACLAWVANWHFAAAGTDYLTGTLPSPLQHYWSLAVEEQFYVFWPWVLLLGAWLGARLLGGGERPSAGARVAGIRLVIGAACVVTLLWSIWLSAVLPQIGYFDLVSRVWEFGAGALVGLAGAGPRWWPGWARRWATLAGLLVIVGSAFVIDGHTPFPGPGAIPVVFGTVLVLLGSDDSYAAGLMTNPVARYVGDISYSLYLWHFPVVVLAHSIWGRGGVGVAVGSAVVMLALSVLSYRYVETPARHSRWLRNWERPAPAPVRRQVWVGAAIAAALVLAVGWQANPHHVFVVAERTVSTTRLVAGAPFTSEEQIRAAVAEGLDDPPATTIPSPDALTRAQLSPEMTECTNDVSATSLTVCDSGGTGRSYALIGDSVALAWAPTVRAALPEGARLMVIGIASCSPWTVTHGATFTRAHFAQDCDRSRTAMIDRVLAEQPDVVLAASAMEFPLQEDTSDLDGNWERGAVRTLSRFTDDGMHAVVLGSPPLISDPRECLNRITGSRRCTVTIGELDIRKRTAESRAARAVRGTLVDVTQWFCRDQRCPLIIGPYLSRTDTTHITAAMATALAPLLRRELAGGGAS